MKKYTKPELKAFELEVEDIVTTSSSPAITEVKEWMTTGENAVLPENTVDFTNEIRW